MIDNKVSNLFLCNDCIDKDHPQFDLGRVNQSDPQTLRNPSPDTDIAQSRLPSSIDYDFDTDVDGFVGIPSASIEWNSANLSLNYTENNTSFFAIDALWRAGLSVDSSVYPMVKVRMRPIDVNSDKSKWRGGLLFKRTGDISYTSGGNVPYPFTVQSGDQWVVAIWDLRDNSVWNGTIVDIRFLMHIERFENQDPRPVNLIEIDYVRFERGTVVP